MNIKISARNVPVTTTESGTSVCFAMVSTLDAASNQHKKLGETEAVSGENPDFDREIPVRYNFWEVQEIVIVLEGTINEKVCFQFRKCVKLSEILMNPNSTCVETDSPGEEKTLIILSTIKTNAETPYFRISLSMDVKENPLLGTSFFDIYRRVGKSSWKKIYESEKIKNIKKLKFKKFDINAAGDLSENEFKLVASTKNKIVGEFIFDLISSNKQIQAGVKLENKDGPAKSKHAFVIFEDICKKKRFSFTDYLRDQRTFNVAFLVDNTNGNRGRLFKKSYHNSNADNAYLETIRVLEPIVSQYTKTEGCHLGTFGSRDVIGKDYASFTGNTDNPNLCHGYNELEKTYMACTGFGDLKKFRTMSIWDLTNCNYLTLEDYLIAILMITESSFRTNSFSEMLLKFSEAPVSLIVVGIGPGRFMNIKSAISEVRKKKRECCTFLKFEKIKKETDADNFDLSFSEAALKPIPIQFLQYCKMNSIAPGKKKHILRIVSRDITNRKKSRSREQESADLPSEEKVPKPNKNENSPVSHPIECKKFSEITEPSKESEEGVSDEKEGESAFENKIEAADDKVLVGQKVFEDGSGLEDERAADDEVPVGQKTHEDGGVSEDETAVDDEVPVGQKAHEDGGVSEDENSEREEEIEKCVSKEREIIGGEDVHEQETASGRECGSDTNEKGVESGDLGERTSEEEKGGQEENFPKERKVPKDNEDDSDAEVLEKASLKDSKMGSRKTDDGEDIGIAQEFGSGDRNSGKESEIKAKNDPIIRRKFIHNGSLSKAKTVSSNPIKIRKDKLGNNTKRLIDIYETIN